MLAIFIRNAIRWFEAWPYIDIRGILEQTPSTLKRRFTPSRVSRSQQETR